MIPTPEEKNIAEEIWTFLWKVQFFGKERKLNEEEKNQLQTLITEKKKELFERIENTGSTSLIEIRKDTTIRLENILNIQSQKIRENITNKTISLDELKKETDIEDIEDDINNILKDIEFLSQFTNNKETQQKIESFKKYLRSI